MEYLTKIFVNFIYFKLKDGLMKVG